MVLYMVPSDASAAMRALDGTNFQGRVLHVLPGEVSTPFHPFLPLFTFFLKLSFVLLLILFIFCDVPIEYNLIFVHQEQRQIEKFSGGTNGKQDMNISSFKKEQETKKKAGSTSSHNWNSLYVRVCAIIISSPLSPLPSPLSPLPSPLSPLPDTYALIERYCG